MTPDAQAVCSELRAAIIRKGWSATARLCSIDRSSLHRAFPAKPRGATPSFTTVTRVAAVFGLRVELAPTEANQS